MNVDYILNSLDHEMYGIGRYVISSYGILKNKVNINPIEFAKTRLNLPRVLNRIHDLYYVKKRLQKGNMHHFTSQGLAYMLNYINANKSIVTCYDLIQYLYMDAYSYSRLQRYLVSSCMNGLKKAQHIIAISEFTKAELMKHLKIPAEKINIAYPAVDSNLYKPLKKNEEIAKKYGIDAGFTNILYVGNEEPRMNLNALIKAIYKLKKTWENIRLIKVGRPGHAGAREKLIRIIKELGLTNDVIFTDYVNETDMPQIYNSCDLFVYPIIYTGFGLPPLESMACGCPTITADTQVLSEVVGDAAVKFNLNDENELAEKMLEVLTNESLRKELACAGPKQCRKFTWERCAEGIVQAYEQLEK